MADLPAHIRELKKRVEREPGSRFFVPLADEYRKAGRLAEAIAALESGLEVHGGYVAARVALARAYLEAGRIEESIAAFSRALADDPSNLVAAKALGDLHLSRGEPLDALKRYLRYRAISGDRRLDEVIDRLEAETAPPPTAPEAASRFSPPPASDRAAPVEPPPPVTPPPALLGLPGPPEDAGGPRSRRHTDPFDITGVPYESPSGPVAVVSGEPEIPSRDLPLDVLASRRPADEEILSRRLRLPEATWPFEPALPPEPGPAPPPASPPAPAEPTGRTLADLYFEQGHYADAAAAYGELAAAEPGNEELARRRDDAASRAAGPAPPDLPSGDPARERRIAKIQLLNEWLDVIRTGAGGRDSERGDRENSGS